jgi:hypothetical protein
MYSMNFRVVPKAGIDTGIESVREILRNAYSMRRNAEGISHLEGYRKEWDDKRGCWKDKPLHDATSHGADSFRYFAVTKNNRKQVGTVFF